MAVLQTEYTLRRHPRSAKSEAAPLQIIHRPLHRPHGDRRHIAHFTLHTPHSSSAGCFLRASWTLDRNLHILVDAEAHEHLTLARPRRFPSSNPLELYPGHDKRATQKDRSWSVHRSTSIRMGYHTVRRICCGLEFPSSATKHCVRSRSPSGPAPVNAPRCYSPSLPTSLVASHSCLPDVDQIPPSIPAASRQPA